MKPNRSLAIAAACACLAVWPCLAQAQQTASGGHKTRGFLDANFIVTPPAQDTFDSVAHGTVHGEMSTLLIGYDVPAEKGFDVAGGAFLNETFGLGVAVSRGRSSASPTVRLTLPSPFATNIASIGTLVGGDSMERLETGVHLQAIFRPNTQGPVDVRVYAGPSRYSVTQHLVDVIAYTQVAHDTFNLVTVDDYTSRAATASAWGVNAGADIAYFFSERLGVGAVVRYARASVKISDSARVIFGDAAATQSIKVGGMSVGFGVRTRF